jgi:hypothetical protein
MPTPSLILVPARFKTGKLYTPVATTSGGVVLGASGDFNVTRATTATRVNAIGLIESVASGIPRLDYPIGGGCPALLVEPQAQNIMAQSETLSVSGNWSRTNVLVSGGVIASPDGLTSGTLIVATSGSNTHWIERNAATTVASGAVVTISCFFKAHGTNTFAQLVVGNIAFSPASPFANFNLTGSGSVTAGNYTSAFIQNYGNGWYRCGFTTTAAANGTAGINICPILASGTGRATTFTGDGVNGVYAWGTQIEAGSVATSYIPTAAATVTRNADVASVATSQFPYSATEGTLVVSATTISTVATNGRYAGLYLATDRLIDLFGAGTQYANYKSSDAQQTSFGTWQQSSKIGVVYKVNDYAFVANGTGVVTDTSTSGLTAANQLNLGNYFSGSQLNGHIRQITYLPRRISNTELQARTA